MSIEKKMEILDTLEVVELFESGIHSGNIIGISPQIDRVTRFLENEKDSEVWVIKAVVNEFKNWKSLDDFDDDYFFNWKKVLEYSHRYLKEKLKEENEK